MSDARPTQQLAADVQLCLSEHHRVGYEPVWGERCPVCVERAPFAALDALVARITDLEAQVEDTDEKWMATCEAREADVRRRAEAAEAQVAALTQERDEATDLANHYARTMEGYADRARAAEAALARERKARKAAEELNADAVVAARTNLEARVASEEARAVAAEASLTTARQALTEIATYGDASGRTSGEKDIARRALEATP